MDELVHMLDPRVHPDLALFTSTTMMRLVVAAFLGGMIGLERETAHKAAGLRTNMFICFGSAMFTVLSDRLAGSFGGDHTRIAAQIIPGIGFIGAGSILHSKTGVSGLTTAATIFVVASIGMASGGGLLLPALFATLMLLVALRALGVLEARFNLKPVLMTYELRGDSTEMLIASMNSTLEELHKGLNAVQVGHIGDLSRVTITVLGYPNEHSRLMRSLRSAEGVSYFECLTCNNIESE